MQENFLLMENETEHTCLDSDRATARAHSKHGGHGLLSPHTPGSGRSVWISRHVIWPHFLQRNVDAALTRPASYEIIPGSGICKT
ncbi:hypothetical protein SAMN06298226_2106 [Nitrosovibrio sp. Nv4]|nr:hypothetical protein SAMN06298226_2106 [Nitrosovibrio sp. Nv4]